MFILFPAFLVLHIFGVILWAGGSIVQYIFFTDIPEDCNPNEQSFFIDLIRKVTRVMALTGTGVVWLSGLTMIFIQGAEWLTAHGFIHIKISLGLIAAVLTLMAFYAIRKTAALCSAESPDPTAVMPLMKRWKTLLTILLITLGTAVLVAVFRFFN